MCASIRSFTASGKLPRPTRSLPPCGGRLLLEGGAFPQRHCAPRPRAWTRPGFLFPFHGPGSGSEQCCDPRLRDPSRGLSRRFNSRCSRALSPSGEREFNPFAVVVPECGARRRYRRTTGASLLVTPAVLGLCEGGSKSKDGPRGKNRLPHGESERRRALLPSLPLARLALERGGSAPCTATADTAGCKSVKNFAAPGRRISSRSYSRQYDPPLRPERGLCDRELRRCCLEQRESPGSFEGCDSLRSSLTSFAVVLASSRISNDPPLSVPPALDSPSGRD